MRRRLRSVCWLAPKGLSVQAPADTAGIKGRCIMALIDSERSSVVASETAHFFPDSPILA